MAYRVRSIELVFGYLSQLAQVLECPIRAILFMLEIEDVRAYGVIYYLYVILVLDII